MKLAQSRFWSYRKLPAAKSLPAKKRGMCVEKLGRLACIKEPFRDVFDYKVITQREEFFDDHI